MFWAGSSFLDIYIGTGMVAACQAQARKFVTTAQGRDDALVKLGDWLHDIKPASRVRVWLSGALCQPLMMPVMGKLGRDERDAIATSLAAERLGWREPCAVRVERAEAGEREVAVVLQRSTLTALNDVLATNGVRAASIGPWWSEVLRHAVKQDLVSIAIQDCDSVCFLAGAKGAIDRASVISPVLDRQAADSAIARTCFAWDIPNVAATAHLRFSQEKSATGQEGFAFCEWVEWSP